MSVSLPPFSTQQQEGDPQEAIARLRAEIEAATDDASRGLLLYEVGVLEQRARNDAQAVRDLLAAVNALPEFHEPLERLVAIIERRKSFKNLGKLLDRVCKIAETPDEASRALWMRAAFLEDHAQDITAARASLEEALRADPSDPTPWLFLELLAAHTSDEALRKRALAGRAELATQPEWKALLLTDLAALLSESDLEGAAKALERAMALKSPATLRAADSLAELGRRSGRDDIAARALEATATLVLRSTQDPNVGDSLGVPRLRRSAAHAADAWLRSAEALRRRGDLAGARKLLQQARNQLPSESALSRAALRLAEASGDTEGCAALAREELTRGVTGPAAAALWLRLAEAAASGGDGAGALEALSKALREDPGSIPARALQLDLLTGTGDARGLARALDEAAQFMTAGAAKARLDLARADVLAREVRDVAAAQDALAEAAALDPTSAATAARMARALASFVGDAGWQRGATERLLDLEGTPSLAAELLREAMLDADASALEVALRRLEGSEPGTRLARLMRAFGQKETNGHADVATLAETCAAPERAEALRLLAAFRAFASGDLEAADGYLSAAVTRRPDDVLAASMLSAVRRLRGDLVGASRALADCAEWLTDAELKLAWALEAGLLAWQAGERQRAVALFAGAAEINASAGTVLAWALRAAEPDDLASRRKALGTLTSPSEQAVALLEELGLDLASGVAVTGALDSLEGRAGELPESMAAVPALARAIMGPTPDHRHAGLMALAEHGGSARAIAAAAHAAALADRSGGDPARIQQTARAWALADGGPAAALEWLVVGVKDRAPETQALALRTLVGSLRGDTAAAVASSAEIIRQLSGGSPRLVGREEAPARLADLETSPPGADPARRAYALERAAQVLGSETADLARVLVGYNALAAGNAERAIAEFDAYSSQNPEDLAGWEGLLEASERAGVPAMVAKACAALGDGATDDAIAAEYWERAAQVLAQEVGDAGRAELALERAVARDIRRFSSFDRLFRIVRTRKDGERLLELISARLEVADDPAEIAKLFWERARVLRQKRDHASALEALENVVMLEPDHVGALALRGEIFITEQRFEEAAGELQSLAALPEAPQQQRLMSGIAAADIYENKLGDPRRALDVLAALDRDGLSTLVVRERFARSAAKAEAWEEAATALERLATERDTRDNRAAAARLAMAIRRDRLQETGRAERAIDLLLAELPDDGEALDFVLDGGFPDDPARRWLERGRDATSRALVADPGDVERAKRLAELGRALHDPTLRQVALGIRVAAGDRDRATEAELAALDDRALLAPTVAIDDSIVALIRDPEDSGPLADLFRELAPALAEALGPNLNALGVQRRDRIKAKEAVPVRSDIAAWAAAMRIDDFELYVGGRDADGICGIPGEVLTIVCGEGVQAPLSAGHRAAVARELLALRLGTSFLRHRDPTDVAALVAACFGIAGVETGDPPYAMQGEFQRQLGKEMSRKLRKQLPELVLPIASRRPDPIKWVRAATSTLDRMAALAVGDPSWALVSAGADRGRLLATEDGKQRASRLLSYVLSPAFAGVRARLGLAS